MKYLIGNTVINTDQIVMAKYDAARSGIDDESGQPYNLESRVEITLTSVEMDYKEGYEGEVYGVSNKSTVIVYKGETADIFWMAYSGGAYRVVTP